MQSSLFTQTTNTIIKHNQENIYDHYALLDTFHLYNSLPLKDVFR